jgi:hypothetical protein
VALARAGIAAERGSGAPLEQLIAQRGPGRDIGARLGRIEIDLALDDRHGALPHDNSSVRVMARRAQKANRRRRADAPCAILQRAFGSADLG